MPRKSKDESAIDVEDGPAIRIPEPPHLKTSRRRGDEIELRVGNQFSIGNKIDAGSFGAIYEGAKIGDEAYTEPLVIKLEALDAKHPQLLYEARLCKILQGGGSAVGIPKLYWYGIEGDYYAMVLEMLDWSLEHLFNYCGRRFNLKTVLSLAEQMVSRLEYFHSKNFVHRDLKPDNFLMGLGAQAHIVYLVDYGLAKRFRNSTTMRHISPKDGKPFLGTARYASINAHEGKEQSRRDDMESLGYILVYFYKGSLPWQGMDGLTQRQKYEKIKERKQSMTIDELMSDMPEEFRLYMLHIKALNFTEKPDYNYLRKLFRDLYQKHQFGTMDHEYDWTARRALDMERRKHQEFRVQTAEKQGKTLDLEF
jgi:serine/threonine protein kinase|mmetsp:Transcript_79476/g.133107  ORF Transcript_79476/g.133107 Transcript_79476/m.133107 type:complete len:366 (+) Transcript_79476:92-1189(+)